LDFKKFDILTVEGVETASVCQRSNFRGDQSSCYRDIVIFGATVCTTVRPMLSDRCMSVLSVCLWCWCKLIVAKRLDGSRWNLAWR